MFLNVTHLKYITCTHSFKAALIAFLVTSWLNWPRHCMHSSFRALIWKDTGYSARRCLCACNRRSRALSTVPFPRSFDSRLLLKWSWSVRLKRLPFDVVIRTFCDWINALLVKRNSDRNSSCECGGQPYPRPCANCVKLKKLIACVNALILTPLIYIYIYIFFFFFFFFRNM